MGNIMDNEEKKIKKPKKTPRIKHKKLIILFTAILVVATVFVIKMFSTKHYALAEETESFEKERPTSGNPMDYSGKDNAAICNWVISHTQEFKSVTTGTVKAKVAVINYNQDIHNTRIVTKDGCYIETISDSSLVHVYEEKYLENKQVVVRKNHSNKYTTITNDVFLEKYGWHPREFQAYILNEETILEATIEEYEGNYKLTLILDPVKSSPKKQRETKTIGNASDYPGYKTTELTVILTSDWTPIEVDTYEVYDIAMPGLGSITCKCNMVEVIEYGEFEIPDRDIFKQHITDEVSDLVDDEKDVISYLQEIFGPLIQGQMNDFDITIDALDTKLAGKLNLELGSGINVNADIDDIFVSYQGDNVYIKLGENKYKVNINEIKKYLGNTSSNNLNTSFDLNSLLNQVQAAKITKDNDKLTVEINLDVMGIKAKALIYASVLDNTYKFNNIYATVDIMGKIIVLTMEPSTKYSYPVIDNTYDDISNMGFVIDSVKNLINKPVEITLDTTISNVKLSGNVLYNNGLASGNITINDKYNINVYYNNETIYLAYNDTFFKLNINDISSLMDKEIKLPDVNVKLSEILDIVKSLDIDMLSETSFDLSIDLTKITDLLKDIKLNVSKTDVLSFEVPKYNLKVTVNETTKEVEANPNVEYNDLANIKWLVDIIMDAINYDAYSFDVDVVYGDLKVNGNIYLDKSLNVSGLIDVIYKDYEFKNIELNYIDNVVYASYKDIKVKISVDSILSLMGDTPKLDFDIDSLVDNFKLALNEDSLDIDLDLTSMSGFLGKLGNVNVLVNNEKKVNITTDLVKASIIFAGTAKKDITINTSEYTDLSNISWLVNNIKDALDYEAYNFSVDLTYNELKISGNVYLDKDLNVSALLNVVYKNYEINDIEFNYIDETIYLSLFNIKIKASLEDILGYAGDTPKFDINDLISNITLGSTNSSFSVALTNTIDGLLKKLGNINLLVDNTNSVNLTTDLINANIKFSEATKKDITINDTDYISLSSLDWLIDSIKEVINYEAYKFDINLEYKDLKVIGSIYLNKDLGVEANLDISYAGLLLNDIVLMYKDNLVYVKYANTTIKVDINDINDIIAKINEAFELNISTDSLKFDIDLISILNSITLSTSTNSIEINADLTSISSLLGNVKLSIDNTLNIFVNTIDIKLEANLVEASYKEINLPDASINKEEIDLIIEYAKELKELVLKWRYNIGFELHVNGYDVYARANIVTFKPEKGLSLYGKVILVKGKLKYYIEASIIDNVAFLNFSQTITNFNSSNPINSTTSQSIKFKINFNELIDVANYALDALNIDNDSIKMAITYLGTIVNTNGDFDELYDDISSKVKSFDLSMLNDFIDISQIGLFVNDTNLTIDFGTNSLGNNHYMSIFREDGKIKGLDVVDFEINSDILNGHFEMLPDENITSANYAGCLDLNGIGNLIKAGLDNYNKSEIELNGSADLELLGIKVAGVTIKGKISFKDKIKADIYLKVPKVLIATNAETEDYIYIYNDMIYIKRVTQEGGFLGIGTKTVTVTRKMSLSDFGTDALEQIIWIFNFGDTVANEIRNAESVDPKIEEVLKSYSKSGNNYSVTLDGEKLVGSSAFSDINLGLTVTTINDLYYLSKISVNAKIVSVITVDANLTVNNGTISWSSFPTEATLNGYTTYNIPKN